MSARTRSRRRGGFLLPRRLAFRPCRGEFVPVEMRSAILALLALLPPAAFSADPEDLYSRVVPPNDPTPAELIANGTIVWGDDFSNDTVLGSQIIVNDANLEQETGVPGPVSSLSVVHIPINSRRTDYADITR